MLGAAWECFLNAVQADFYLAQESRPYPKAQEGHMVWNEIGGTRDWGSGIYSPKYEINEEDIGSKFKGALTIANANVTDTPLTLVSLYGLMESSGSAKGYSVTNLHRMLSDLTGLLNGHVGGKRNIILGGDLNASTQFDAVQKNHSHELFFARMADFGLQDAYVLAGNKTHVQTLRRTHNDTPWQDDYLFISKKLAHGFKSIEIIDTEEVRRFSEHNILLTAVEL